MILKSKLLQKGLVFFSIPLMVAFSFIIFLNNTLKESQRELEVQLHAKQALTNANSLLTDYTEAAVSVGIYGISREPNFRRRYEYWVPLVRQDLASLRSLFQGDGSKTEALERLTNLVNNGLAELDGSMESIDDNRVDVSTHRGTVSYKRLTRIRDLLRSTINTLIEDAKKIEEQGKEKRESMSRRLDNVLRWGVILNAWAAFFLIAFFIRGISRRLGVMTDNTMRLAAGRTLNQPIGGDDEIGQLDRVFHQMATALEEAARKERAVINYAADVICSVDSYGAFTAVSPACTSTWGYSPEDLLGRRLIDIVEPGDSAHTSQVLDDVKRQAGTVTFDNRTRRADGAVVNILWSVQWSAAEQSIFCVAHDITERKLAEEALKVSEARVRSIIESTLVGLIVVSLDGKVRIANPSAIDMFGYDWQELTERHFVTLFGEGRAAADDYDIEKCWQMILDKSIDHLCEVEAFRKSGEGFPVQLSLNEFQAAEGTCYLANILDISELRELERRRREFVATVTHELRTPLTSIYGSMSLLLTDPNLAPKNKEMIAIAERSCSRLIKLINDLLDVEKLDTGMLLLELDVVGIATVVKRSVEAVEVLAEKSKIEIRTEIEELDVVADEDRLVQVLVNLLSNAIKFSPAGETVSVRAFKVNRDKVAGSAASAGAGTSHTDGNSRPDSPASNLVEIQVIDKGRGIPESARKLLFHRFQQVEAGDAKEKGGTGLGLAICKAIITQHDGGSIGVDSEEGKGSTFWFRLPSA